MSLCEKSTSTEVHTRQSGMQGAELRTLERLHVDITRNITGTLSLLQIHWPYYINRVFTLFHFKLILKWDPQSV